MEHVYEHPKQGHRVRLIPLPAVDTLHFYQKLLIDLWNTSDDGRLPTVLLPGVRCPASLFLPRPVAWTASDTLDTGTGGGASAGVGHPHLLPALLPLKTTFSPSKHSLVWTISVGEGGKGLRGEVVQVPLPWEGVGKRAPMAVLLTNVMVVVAVHTPCRGGGVVEHTETSSARPAPKRVPHRVPKPVEHSFRHVLRFEPQGVLIPVRCPSVLPLVLFALLLSIRIAQE